VLTVAAGVGMATLATLDTASSTAATVFGWVFGGVAALAGLWMVGWFVVAVVLDWDPGLDRVMREHPVTAASVVAFRAAHGLPPVTVRGHITVQQRQPRGLVRRRRGE
jgi:hypothetical protein